MLDKSKRKWALNTTILSDIAVGKIYLTGKYVTAYNKLVFYGLKNYGVKNI